jgi:hypothetical protein
LDAAERVLVAFEVESLVTRGREVETAHEEAEDDGGRAGERRVGIR